MKNGHGGVKLRFGLCCIFLSGPVKFRTLYANNLRNLGRKEALSKISSICLSNSRNLILALEMVKRLSIGAFRINSKFFPLYTHPDMRYRLDDLKDRDEILGTLERCRHLAKANDTRLSFHPDQFVILSSPREDVARSSIEELEYHRTTASLVGAELVNIHVGGRYDGKAGAFERFRKNFMKLSKEARSLLTIENDDIIYTPSDVDGLAASVGIPFVYDVHHHRCNPDSLGELEATRLCIASWKKFRPGQEPYFHVSSPRSPGAREHSDYIVPDDLPVFWRGLKATVDVEAKAKELAVTRLMRSLDNFN